MARLFDARRAGDTEHKRNAVTCAVANRRVSDGDEFRVRQRFLRGLEKHRGWPCIDAMDILGRALRAEAMAFKPDVILSYWLYPDAFGALRVARGGVRDRGVVGEIGGIEMGSIRGK